MSERFSSSQQIDPDRDFPDLAAAITALPTVEPGGSALAAAAELRALMVLQRRLAAAVLDRLACFDAQGFALASGSASTAASSGVATFSNLSIDKAGTAYTLTASSNGLVSNVSLPFNIVGGSDLNGDGFSNNDRPIGIGRNSMYLPNRYNMDLRYSRFVPIRGDVRAELIGEFKNIFNTEQTQSINSTVKVDTLGNPASPIPTTFGPGGFAQTAGFEQREFQLGFRLRF